jgi:adenylate cyclase
MLSEVLFFMGDLRFYYNNTGCIFKRTAERWYSIKLIMSGNTMERSTQLKFKQLAVIIALYLVIGFIMTVYSHLVLHANVSQGPRPDYSFLTEVTRNMAGGLLGALLGGSFLVFFVNVKYQDKPYAYTIIAVSVAFVMIFVIITVFMGVVIVLYQTGKPLTDSVAQHALIEFLTNTAHLKSAIGWSLVVAVTQLLLQVNSKFGQGAFWNIIRGKYNTAKEEERIFMFLDLNSSTAIAERLGNTKYHNLLKDFFSDITYPIIENKGEIYQYVGDEIVLTWAPGEQAQYRQCITCFFEIKLHIEKHREKYLSKYGLVPSFKAGIHYGMVTVGEIGIIKRDITCSGDVLNTTARILSMCNELNEELVVSGELVSKIQVLDNYVTQSLGHIKLRGKEKELLLVSITPS